VTKFECEKDSKSDILVHPMPTQASEGGSVEFNCTAYSRDEGNGMQI